MSEVTPDYQMLTFACLAYGPSSHYLRTLPKDRSTGYRNVSKSSLSEKSKLIPDLW